MRKGEEKNDNKQNLYDNFEREFGRTLSPMEYEIISSWLDSGISKELIIEALMQPKPRERLKPKAPSKNILDASFNKMCELLKWKVKLQGKYYYQVDTYYASSKTCNHCDNKTDKTNVNTIDTNPKIKADICVNTEPNPKHNQQPKSGIYF